jgi:hypothetical protein
MLKVFHCFNKECSRYLRGYGLLGVLEALTEVLKWEVKMRLEKSEEQGTIQ